MTVVKLKKKKKKNATDKKQKKQFQKFTRYQTVIVFCVKCKPREMLFWKYNVYGLIMKCVLFQII